MSSSSWRVASPSMREWPVLRDLLLSAPDHDQCLDLTCAVADAPRPAAVWRERLADLVGDGRFAAFARSPQSEVGGFVAAYLDGDGDRVGACVIVRHYLALDSVGPDVGAALLRAVEDWALLGPATEILFEVVGDHPDLEELLAARGYRAGVRGVCAEEFLGARGDAEGLPTREWVRPVSVPVESVTGPRLAAVS